MKQSVVCNLHPLALAYDKRGTTYASPQRAFEVERFIVPAVCERYMLLSIRIGNIELLAAPCPAWVFSPYAIGIEPHCPPVYPGINITVEALAPARPRPVHFAQWRSRSGATRRGLRPLPRPQQPTRSRRLFMKRGAWPSWLPRPLPPPFYFTAYGSLLPRRPHVARGLQ